MEQAGRAGHEGGARRRGAERWRTGRKRAG